jgi:pseudouridine kinase
MGFYGAVDQEISDTHRRHVLTTLGRCGMVCAEDSGSTWHLPATPTEVRDACGAGDTVFAAMAVGMLTRKSLREACRSSMLTAASQVASLGVASVA